MYKISIDTGGTFTDCICEKSNGEIVKLKLLSKSVLRSTIVQVIDEYTLIIKDNWGFKIDFFEGFSFKEIGVETEILSVKSFEPSLKILRLKSPIFSKNEQFERSFELFTNEEVPVFATRLLTQTALNQQFTEIELRLGSTKGTNALLEGKGAKVLFVVTKGFKDLLAIGNQARPDIFALEIKKPQPLHHLILEVSEQIDAFGNIIIPIETKVVLNEILKFNSNFESIAICFKNSYKNAIHEIELEKELSAHFLNISISTKLSSQIKLVPRAETTVTNAYLSPIINSYLKGIQQKLNSEFLVNTSAGSLLGATQFQPKDSLLSGPAGGIVGAVDIAQALGFEQIISFDMGGTSTDVARYNGAFDYKSEITIGHATIFSPAFAIETVAAGGGSICDFDGFKLTVGPLSAGSSPGPACYGANGPFTITDTNLLLGRLDESNFSIPIYSDKAKEKLQNILQNIEVREGSKIEKEEVLEGFLQIANEKMADAIRKVSVAKGFNPSEYALVAFGGAGGMHACAIANLLGITKIIVPADAGLLSAYGISKTSIQKIVERSVSLDFSKDNIAIIQSQISELENEAFLELKANTAGPAEVKNRTLKLRFKGQDAPINIDFNSTLNFDSIAESFKNEFSKIYNFYLENRVIELSGISVQVAEIQCDNADELQIKNNAILPVYFPKKEHFKLTFYNNIWQNIPVYNRSDLHAGAVIFGFALLVDSFATTVIEQGWKLTITENLSAIIEVESAEIIHKEITETAELELFTNRFMNIAEQMGLLLQRTSLSVNVKERLDFSCALLDANAKLIANAPHIPVHLGSLGVCVRSVLKVIDIGPGDIIITNHPKYGGSHLPDVTIISGVYTAQNELVGYVANRCHHSEIGGIRPASMPPNATNLAEEGVVIPPMYLMKNEVLQIENIKNILENAQYPSRKVDENIADIYAAIAANNRGRDALLKMVNSFGLHKVKYFMAALLNNSSQILQDKLKMYQNAQFVAEEYLDDGSKLNVATSVLNTGDCIFDFTGSSSVHSGNLNANFAIVSSVVVYVLRLLVNKPIPLNEGLMEKVKLIVPENSILNPIFDDDPTNAPAVVGGNVETSQRLTDTILKAFGIVACSQGTMNNTLFGNETFGYYETICGGSGAGDGFDGASAVHTHMTNTRITDPEILELRYPVYLNRFEIRQNSGGKGKFNGGDGIIREIEFLEPVKLSVLSQHRKVAPFGILGGANAKTGEQKIIKKTGEIIELEGNSAFDIEAGDRFIIETPGGGGWG